MHCKSKNKKREKILFTIIKCYIVGSISVGTYIAIRCSVPAMLYPAPKCLF